MNIHQRLLSWRSSQESHRIDPSLGSQLPVTPSHEHFFMSSTSRLQRRPGNNFDPCLRNKVRTRKATSMHLKLQQVQETGRLRPMRPSRLWRHTMSDEHPVFAPDSNPREAKSPSPVCASFTFWFGARDGSHSWQIGTMEDWCSWRWLVLHFHDRVPEGFSFILSTSFPEQSDVLFEIYFSSRMQYAICCMHSRGRWHRVSRHLSGQKSHTLSGKKSNAVCNFCLRTQNFNSLQSCLSMTIRFNAICNL